VNVAFPVVQIEESRGLVPTTGVKQKSSPTAKSPKLLTPVACMDVDSGDAVVGDPHAEEI